jgi:hypothetical protein
MWEEDASPCSSRTPLPSLGHSRTVSRTPEVLTVCSSSMDGEAYRLDRCPAYAAGSRHGGRMHGALEHLEGEPEWTDGEWITGPAS